MYTWMTNCARDSGCGCPPKTPQSRYDLLLKDGYVIDPKNRTSAVRDVAIRDGKVAAVSPEIPA